MNTLQAVNGGSFAGIPVEQNTKQRVQSSTEGRHVTSADHISGSANDEVVVKVLNTQISESFDASVEAEVINFPNNSLGDKLTKSLQVQDDYSVESVVTNVSAFVGKAIASLAQQGHDTEQLMFMREQAKLGVETGIEKAKHELANVLSSAVLDKIDHTKGALMDAIDSIPVDASEYASIQSTFESDEDYAKINISRANAPSVVLEFGTTPFIDSEKAALDVSNVVENYETRISQISYSISNETANQAMSGYTEKLADFVNQADGLLHTFFRKGIASDYQIASLSTTDDELLHIAKTQEDSTHLSEEGRNVVDYLDKYLDLLDSGNNVLTSENDFNSIINGIINEMSDVQIPDLVSAINKFHQFNSKFQNDIDVIA